MPRDEAELARDRGYATSHDEVIAGPRLHRRAGAGARAAGRRAGRRLRHERRGRGRHRRAAARGRRRDRGGPALSGDGSPPAEVVAAFGGTGAVRAAPGWTRGHLAAGAVVLRPAEGDGETEWASEVLSGCGPPPNSRCRRRCGMTAARGRATAWHAIRWVPGHADPSRVDEVLRAGDAFHRALAGIPKPDFLDRRSHPWARADRIAWGEETGPADPLLDGCMTRTVRSTSPAS